MANTYKVLGQSNPAIATQANLYVVPPATSAVCSTLVICNQGLTTTYRIAVRPAGTTLTSTHYLVYDSAINSTDSVFLTMGITLATTDIVAVWANTANVSFSLFGSEIT